MDTSIITTGARVNFDEVARKTIRRIGYNDPAIGFDTSTCTVIVAYGEQSQDIAQGVDEGKGLDLDQGAGDQGLMFGYACDETPQYMPLAIHLSHRLVERQSELRRDGRLPWLRPDAKSQVTLRYTDGKPEAIETVVLSTQHQPGLTHKQIEEAVILPNVTIKRNCRLRKVVIDRGCVIPDGMVVGEDAQLDGQRFFRSPSGITLITREMLQRLDGTTQEDLH